MSLISRFIVLFFCVSAVYAPIPKLGDTPLTALSKANLQGISGVPEITECSDEIRDWFFAKVVDREDFDPNNPKTKLSDSTSVLSSMTYSTHCAWRELSLTPSLPYWYDIISALGA